MIIVYPEQQQCEGSHSRQWFARHDGIRRSKTFARRSTILTTRPARQPCTESRSQLCACVSNRSASQRDDAWVAASDEGLRGATSLRPPSRQPTHRWAPTDVLGRSRSAILISTVACVCGRATATRRRLCATVGRTLLHPVKNVGTSFNSFDCATPRVSRARCRDASSTPVSAIAARISV
jgi:hypothetical protein